MTSVQQIMAAKAAMAGTPVMAPQSVALQRHDYLVSVLFGDLLSHSYNITFSMFWYLVQLRLGRSKGGPICSRSYFVVNKLSCFVGSKLSYFVVQAL